jgi:hypothetical protein
MTSSSSSVPMYNLILRIIQVAWWLMQVLGADECEEEKILSYIKERISNERWISSSSSASAASSVDSEISEQSTIWSPGGEQLTTEQPLFCNKLSTTPQALLGAALTPEGRDPCSQIGMISMCNHSSHPPCRNGESNSMPLNVYSFLPSIKSLQWNGFRIFGEKQFDGLLHFLLLSLVCNMISSEDVL